MDTVGKNTRAIDDYIRDPLSADEKILIFISFHGTFLIKKRHIYNERDTDVFLT